VAEITLLYVHGTVLGYGRYGVHLAKALGDAGVDVYDQLEPGSDQHKLTNVVAWVSVPSHARRWWQGQVPVISTMWEATQLPEGFRENLDSFDTVIVPSDQNVELFSQYHPNVRKVQLGVDREVWHYVPRQPPTTEFRFLIAGSGVRKGTDLAHKAFKLAFPYRTPSDDPVPKLLMKNPKNEDFGGRNITIISGRLTDEAEVSLYASAHCYLQPSRGEGFGLQPLQAIAQGCPTILTDAHGHRDFAHLGIGLSTTMEPAAYFIYGDAGEWWLPSLDELVDAMRYVYDNYDHVAKVAQIDAEVAAAQWGWEHTARQFIDAVGLDALTTPYAGNRTWVLPQSRLYKVMVNQPWVADIGDRKLYFERGREYWEPADVKRVLFEAGLLDPACLDENPGLTEEQATRIGAYKAEHEWCPVCNQRLGSGVTRADVIYEELMGR
jgi:glycosyltransferase involved in cell wall biosynthesis